MGFFMKKKRKEGNESTQVSQDQNESPQSCLFLLPRVRGLGRHCMSHCRLCLAIRQSLGMVSRNSILRCIYEVMTDF